MNGPWVYPHVLECPLASKTGIKEIYLLEYDMRMFLDTIKVKSKMFRERKKYLLTFQITMLMTDADD